MEPGMAEAFRQARLGAREGGIPIGSSLVRQGQVLGSGRNRRVQQNNPILHAEIDCLQTVGRIGSYEGVTLYSTLMPCYLCAGAVVQFGIRAVIVGENETFSGADQLMRQHGVSVTNLDLDECKQLMRTFIEENPVLWKEDIGELSVNSKTT